METQHLVDTSAANSPLLNTKTPSEASLIENSLKELLNPSSS